MTWVSRPQWGASAQSPAQGVMPPHPRGVAIHWIGPGRWQHQDPLALMRQIRGWHQGNGHADIDYSLAVSADGRILEGRSTRARPRVRPASNGSRATNDSHYSVVMLTGQADPAPPPAMLAAAGQAVAWLRSAGGAGAQVVGHRDLHPTTCPGDTIQSLLPQIAAAAGGATIGDDEMTPEDRRMLHEVHWMLTQLRSADLARVLAPVDETHWMIQNVVIPQQRTALESDGLPFTTPTYDAEG